MSDLFKLNGKDFLNGLIMAVIGNVVVYLMAIFSELYKLVMNGDPFSITINWNAVLVVGITSALTYLSKRLVSGPTGNVLVK